MIDKNFVDGLKIEIEAVMKQGQQEALQLYELEKQVTILKGMLKKREGVILGYQHVIEMIDKNESNK